MKKRTGDDQKKEIIFNALNEGWEVRKVNDNKTDGSSYCFKKTRKVAKVAKVSGDKTG
jgi:hypothetical protein